MEGYGRTSAVLVARTLAATAAAFRHVIAVGTPLLWLKVRVEEVSCVEVGAADGISGWDKSMASLGKLTF